MKFPSYQHYKDSGIDWLGEIPEHWEQLRLSWLFRRSKTINRPDAELLSIYRDFGVIPKSSRDDNFNKPSDDLSAYQLVEVGDLVLNKMKTWQGSIAISEFEGIVSPAYFVAKPRREFILRFVHYLLRSPVYISQYLRYSKGIRPNQWDLDFDDFRVIPAIMPPIEEQKAIAEFLDAETLKIDKLIGKQERLIALLQEKRQSLISRVITKGLNLTAPTRDSGIEWLGEMPAHWEIKRLWHLTPDDRQIMYGIVLPGPNVDGGVPIVKGGDVSPNRLKLQLLNRTTREIESSYVRSRLKGGDLVYAIRGSIGLVEVVPDELTGANLTQDAARISPKRGINNCWLLFALKAHSVFSQLDARAVGASVKGINIRDLKRALIPVPPIDEQEVIAEHLHHETSKIDALMEKARSAIELLNEHRTALISSAVTGKIDVRQYRNGNLSNH